jgi:hypothetical protein
MRSSFVLGVVTGVVLGLRTSRSPVIAIAAILAVFVATVISVGQRREPTRTIQLAGALVGAGAVLAFGTFNTVAACVDTEDFCGNADVWPLGAFAVVTIGMGAMATVAALRTAP